MKQKRGISPIVATVLLVALVVIIAIIIFLWARGFIKENVMKDNRNAAEICKDISLESEIDNGLLVVSNTGNYPVHSLKIKGITAGDSEIEVFEPVGGIGVGDTVDTIDVSDYDSILIVPKILGQNKNNENRIFECSEEDGFTKDL